MNKLFKRITVLIGISSLSLSLAANAEKQKNIHITMQTTKGDIKLELYPNEAPETVKNFMAYVKSDFYDNTIFHRVVKNFVIQGGGFDTQGKEKKTNPPIINESKNGLFNDRGTISMARTMDPNSATSQFFINARNNGALDPRMGQPGYAVFGAVTEGFDVVKTINTLPIKSRGGVFAELTEEPVVIKDIIVHK